VINEAENGGTSLFTNPFVHSVTKNDVILCPSCSFILQYYWHLPRTKFGRDYQRQSDVTQNVH